MFSFSFPFIFFPFIMCRPKVPNNDATDTIEKWLEYGDEILEKRRIAKAYKDQTPEVPPVIDEPQELFMFQAETDDDDYELPLCTPVSSYEDNVKVPKVAANKRSTRQRVKNWFHRLPTNIKRQLKPKTKKKVSFCQFQSLRLEVIATPEEIETNDLRMRIVDVESPENIEPSSCFYGYVDVRCPVESSTSAIQEVCNRATSNHYFDSDVSWCDSDDSSTTTDTSDSESTDSDDLEDDETSDSFLSNDSSKRFFTLFSRSPPVSLANTPDSAKSYLTVTSALSRSSSIRNGVKYLLRTDRFKTRVRPILSSRVNRNEKAEMNAHWLAAYEDLSGHVNYTSIETGKTFVMKLLEDYYKIKELQKYNYYKNNENDIAF